MADEAKKNTALVAVVNSIAKQCSWFQIWYLMHTHYVSSGKSYRTSALYNIDLNLVYFLQPLKMQIYVQALGSITSKQRWHHFTNYLHLHWHDCRGQRGDIPCYFVIEYPNYPTEQLA